MSKHRSLSFGLGMLACGALVIFSAMGFASVLRRQPASAPTEVAQREAEPVAAASTVAPAMPVPTPTFTPNPDGLTSVRVPILMYHHLKDLPADADPEYQQLAVAPQNFEEQVAFMQANGYHTITFAELVAAFNGQMSLPDNPVIITFDDGWEDIYNVAYPILREHGLRATFFIPTNWIENLEGTVSWAQIEEMSNGGMEFGSHSVTHPYLTTADPDWLKYELEGSKAALEEHTKKTITALAYPFGLYDDNVIAAVQAAGYLTACTIDAGATAKADGLLTLPRLWVYDWMTLQDFEAQLKSS